MGGAGRGDGEGTGRDRGVAGSLKRGGQEPDPLLLQWLQVHSQWRCAIGPAVALAHVRHRWGRPTSGPPYPPAPSACASYDSGANRSTHNPILRLPPPTSSYRQNSTPARPAASPAQPAPALQRRPRQPSAYGPSVTLHHGPQASRSLQSGLDRLQLADALQLAPIAVHTPAHPDTHPQPRLPAHTHTPTHPHAHPHGQPIETQTRMQQLIPPSAAANRTDPGHQQGTRPYEGTTLDGDGAEASSSHG